MVSGQFLIIMASVSEEVLEPIRATVTGHRARLEADGFSPTAAEAMASTLHGALVLAAFHIDLGGSPCSTHTPASE